MKDDHEPKLLPIIEIARRVNLHRNTVTERLNALGYQPQPGSKPKCKLFLFDSRMQFALHAASDEMAAARFRILIAEVKLKELKLAVSKGEMILYNDAVEYVYNRIHFVYEEFQNRRIKRIGRKLANCKTAAEVKKVLEDDAEQIFTRLERDLSPGKL